MKLVKLLLAAGLLGMSMGALTASAATISAADGDLFMGVRATGGTNSSINLMVDLGTISTYVNDVGTKRQVTSLGADLASTAGYGANWNSRGDLYWGLAGWQTPSSNPAICVSKAEATAGTKTTGYDAASQGQRTTAKGGIQSVATGMNGSTSTANNPAATFKTYTGGNDYSWTTQENPDSTVAFTLFAITDFENTMVTSGYAASDLWRVGNGSVTYIGTFALDSAGVLWFSKNPADFATPTAPAVTEQPLAAAVGDGQSATFSVTATGTPTPGYAWQVSIDNGGSWTTLTDTAPYAGTTTSTLSINPASLAMSGYQYRVLLTNSVASTPSNAALLTVTGTAPSITTQPQSQSVNQGDTVTFTVTASGTAPLSYQWKLDGNALTDGGGHIAGSTTNTLTITGVQPADAGNYTVVVTNSINSKTSNAATLTIVTAPNAPTATAATGVGSAGFTANWGAVTGATSYRLDVSTSAAFSSYLVGYQDLDVGRNLSAVIANLAENTTYYYRVRAMNAVGASGSSNVVTVITTATPLVIVTPPQSQTVIFGSEVVFTVAVSSNTPLTYQWYHGSTALTDPSATTDTLTLSAVQAGDAGPYSVVVTNAAGSVPSDPATLTVIVPPVAPTATAATALAVTGFTANWNSVADAVSYRLDVSTSSTFSTFVTGFSDLNVGTNLSKQVTGLADNTTYYYRVRAVNSAGTSASSNVIAVTTNAAALAITTQPASQSVIQGANVTFTVAASSSTALSYQWRHDGANLTSPSATTATLVLNNVQPADAGSYDVIVTNAAGPVTSNPATLAVEPPPNAPVATDATAISASGFTANWNASGDTTGYRLDVSTDSAFGSYLSGYQDLDVGTDLSRSLGGLASFTTYYYRVRAVNAAGASPSSNAVAVTTLPALPVVTTQPQPAGVHPGDTVVLTVAVAGTPPFTYQWGKVSGNTLVGLMDGGIVAGSTTATLTLTGVAPGDAGDYAVTVTNAAGSITSDTATVTVTNTNIAPAFTKQPAGLTVNQGGTATFTVAASGVPTPTITWMHEGNVVAGATGATLTLQNVQAADAGRYVAVATNLAGSVNSNEAVLGVNLPPVITTAPASQTIDQGGTATFTVAATGSPAPTYQWYKNNNAITGATAATYVVANAQAADAADYTVVATNVAGTATSAKATLVVNLPPAITTQPAVLQSVNLGSSVSFTVVASGVPAPTYQWRKDGADIPSATGASYTIAIVQATDAGRYSVVATNRLGSATSNDAMLVVNVAPGFVTQPAGQTVDQGASVTFSASATGIPAPAYQWLKNGAPITGATGNALTLSSVQSTDAADYTVVAANAAGAATSTKATLVVNYAPVILTPPTATTVAQGNGATFTVTAAGVPTPTYQWLKNGNPVSGATSATLTLATVQPADAGNYSVQVTNRLGSTTSTEAALTVNYAPSITTQPASAATTVGNNTSFSVVAAAVPAPTYQWQLSVDGGNTWSSVAEVSPYSGSTTTTLRITSATTTLAGFRYRTLVRNSLGTATSNPAILTVTKPGATVTLSGLNATYDGTPKAVTATTLPEGLNLTITYNGSTTAPTAAGSYTVVATVSDASYAGTATDTLVIAKVAPQITWNAPAAITYGTALSSTQLNATANVPGTIAYTPAAGAIPGAGSVQLTATFTPTDAKNYASATANQTVVVNKAPLTATADNQTRVYGAANPTLTISYTGFVAGDTSAVLTSVPAASTAATSSSTPGSYPITLTGGAADNYALTLVNGTLTVTSQDYSGEYFGRFDGGGTWALIVHADRTATFIAYLPDRKSAMVVPLTVDATGNFSVAGTEIGAQSLPDAPQTVHAESVATDGGTVAKAVASAFTLSGRIANGSISGQLIGIGQSFSGAQDTGPGAAPGAGYYTAAALQAANGAGYAVVGASGHVFVLVVTPSLVDGASGVVDSSGQFAGPTTGGAALTIALNAAEQSVALSVTPAGSSTPVNFAGAADTAVATGRLTNLSVRSNAGLGDKTLMVGFVVSGSGAKPMLLRAVGPGLSGMSVTDYAYDPKLSLYAGITQPVLVAENNDWQTTFKVDGAWTSLVPTIAQQVGAFALAGGSVDAALYIPSQITAGAYTMQVTDQTGHNGVALAEVYDAGAATRSVRLINLSTRSQVGTGDSVLIAGFVVQGAPPIKLLIRAVGPTLASYGVSGTLADPQLDVYQSVNGTNIRIGGNDNWGGTAALAGAFTATGAFALPANSKDAAVLLTLPSGIYSAVISGVNSTTGVAMVEIYEVP